MKFYLLFILSCIRRSRFQSNISLSIGIDKRRGCKERAKKCLLAAVFIMISGSNRNMLPDQLNQLLNDSKYSWAVFEILVFTLLLELLIIAVML